MAKVIITTNDSEVIANLSDEGWDLSRPLARVSFSEMVYEAIDRAQTIEAAKDSGDVDPR